MLGAYEREFKNVVKGFSRSSSYKLVLLVLFLFSLFLIVVSTSASISFAFYAEGSNVNVKSTTTGLQGSNLDDSSSTKARFLLTVFQPGALAFGNLLKANVGFFELFDVCSPDGECGLFLGDILYCDQGTWKDPDLQESFCTASGCNYVWMDGVSSGTQCCGDDLSNDDSVYYNSSLTSSKYVRCERCYDGSFVTNTTLIGNGVLLGSGTSRTCYYGDITCSVASAQNGSSAVVYGWGYVDNQTCYYGNAVCNDGSYDNSTSCQLSCANGWTWCCTSESTYVTDVSCDAVSGCQATNHDRDESQAYCEESTRGCTSYTWFSGVSQCCGDDLSSDNFEDPGQGNDCCYQGQVIQHGTAYQSLFCWNGELYDCNNQVNLGFETDVANCDEADSSGWYCDADGDPSYWQNGLPIGCAGCDYNSNCSQGYCDAEDGTTEPLYGLTIDYHYCFNCTECAGSPGNFVCSSVNTSLCQYDCAGPGGEDCDDVEPKTCRENSDIYCDYGCIAHDRDEAESYCTTTNVNCVDFHWVNGGEKSSFGEYSIGNELACCGDDAGENYVSSTIDSSTYDACCDDASDCVNASNECLATGTVQNGYICFNSQWDHLPTQENPRIFLHAKLSNDLRAYWTLDDDVKDYTSNNYDGTNQGAVNNLQGYAAGAFNFDGNDYVDLPSDLGYTNQVSAFAWFKSGGSPPGGYHVILGGQELEISVSSAGELRTGVTTDNGRFVSNGGSGLTDGNWHFIGFTFDGTTKKSYIDGVNVNNLSVSGTLVNSFSNRRIGRLGSSTTYYLNGSVDEIMIFDRPLTEKEINDLYNGVAYTKNDLTCAPVNASDVDGDTLSYIVNWYKDGTSLLVLNTPFDSNVSSVSSGRVRDYSPYGNNCTLGGGNLNNAPSYRKANCIAGGCYQFDGNDYIDCGNDPVSSDASVSFEAWVYPMSTSLYNGYILSSGAQTNSVGYALIWNNGQFAFYRKTSTKSVSSGYFGSYGINQWYHLVGVYDDSSGTLDVYVNGNLYNSYSSSSGSYSNTYPLLTIGKPNNVNSYYFQGIIDEVKVYDVPLTAEQVKKNYEAGLNHHQPFVLDYSMTSKHHSYKCEITVNDGYGDSVTKSSSTLTVINTPPTKPSLVSPANDDVLTERKPTFQWSQAQDDDGDSLTYNLDVLFKQCNTVNSEYCTGTNVHQTGLTSLSYTPLSELDIALYSWNVSAYDGENYSESSEVNNFSIEALINISLINDLVSFGSLEPGKTYNTTSGDAQPFSIRNNGNVKVDIKVNASQLFVRAPLDTDAFRIKARDLEPGSINISGSAINWINLADYLKKVIADLDYHDSSDEAYLDILVSVPPDEPPGTKSSSLLFQGELS